MLFTGENAFTLRMALNHIRKEFVQKYSEHGFEQRDGSELSLQELPQLFQGASLFSPQRLVIVSDPGANKAVWEALPDYLDTHEEVTVVLVEPKPDKRTRTYKWLQKQAEVKEFALLIGNDLNNWIQRTAQAKGVNIEPEVARYLVSHVGEDQWRLYHEIEKLSLSGKPVTAELIRDIIDPNPQATAFELLDAAIDGKSRDVERLVGVIRLSEDPYRFVGLLTSQAYALAVCFAAGDRPPAVIAKEAGLHPYVASKTLAISKRLSRERLSLIIQVIAELDSALKSTGVDPWILIESSLIKIAAK